MSLSRAGLQASRCRLGLIRIPVHSALDERSAERLRAHLGARAQRAQTAVQALCVAAYRLGGGCLACTAALIGGGLGVCTAHRPVPPPCFWSGRRPRAPHPCAAPSSGLPQRRAEPRAGPPSSSPRGRLGSLVPPISSLLSYGSDAQGSKELLKGLAVSPRGTSVTCATGTILQSRGLSADVFQEPSGSVPWLQEVRSMTTSAGRSPAEVLGRCPVCERPITSRRKMRVDLGVPYHRRCLRSQDERLMEGTELNGVFSFWGSMAPRGEDVLPNELPWPPSWIEAAGLDRPIIGGRQRRPFTEHEALVLVEPHRAPDVDQLTMIPLREILVDALDVLTQDERDIVTAVLDERLTQMGAAVEFDSSATAIRNIRDVTLLKLRTILVLHPAVSAHMADRGNVVPALSAPEAARAIKATMDGRRKRDASARSLRRFDALLDELRAADGTPIHPTLADGPRRARQLEVLVNIGASAAEIGGGRASVDAAARHASDADRPAMSKLFECCSPSAIASGAASAVERLRFLARGYVRWQTGPQLTAATNDILVVALLGVLWLQDATVGISAVRAA